MQAAIAAQQRGDRAEAERLFRALTASHPHFADAWHYWGLLLHQNGENERGLELLLKAQALEPDNLIFLLNLGRVLREQGQFLHSIACLEKAHRLQPDHPQALVQLVQSMLAVERGQEMLPEIERHLGWAARNWHLQMLLGECREQGGDRPGALAAFAEAARLAPAGETRPQLRRANAARKAQDTASAIRSLESALRIDGSCAQARAGLAGLAAEHGDFARARSLAREALALDRTVYPAWDLLAGVVEQSSLQELARELNQAAESAGKDPGAWPLHFARGRVLEKIRDYDNAFAAYAAGNHTRAAMRPYSRETQTFYSGDFITALDDAFVARAARIGQPGPGVIFICGMPRSGTTLVETILASHPAVTAGGEQRYIHDRLRRELGIVKMTRTGSWLRDVPDAELRLIAREWRDHLAEAVGDRPYVTDKMPGNFALMGLLHVCFPRAPIVHVRRDPRDNCFSCFAMNFAEGHAFSYALDTTGHYYRLHDALVAHWKRVLPPQLIIDVEYEKLVADPETEIRRLLEAVGLEWDPRCLDFHKTSRTVATASLFQVRQPLYSSSIGRWRRFERHLGPLIEELEGPAPL